MSNTDDDPIKTTNTTRSPKSRFTRRFSDMTAVKKSQNNHDCDTRRSVKFKLNRSLTKISQETETDSSKEDLTATDIRVQLPQSRFKVESVSEERRHSDICSSLLLVGHQSRRTSGSQTEDGQKSFGHNTLESLPHADHYRNMFGPDGKLKQRPTLSELHEQRFQEELEQVLEEEETGRLFSSDSSKTQSTSAVKFGWIKGVLVRCVLNIFGVMLFLRLSWVVGQAGIGLASVIILLASVVTTLTALSMSAICTNGEVKGGGAYYMISRSLGPEFGGAIGIIFSIANAVAAAMYIVGFAETVVGILKNHNCLMVDEVNDVRIIGIITAFFILIIALAGLSWEARAQLVLLVILMVAIFDCMVGTFIPPSKEEKEKGFLGYRVQIVRDNFTPDFRDGHSFFSVFGIFFPAATGILAGANISGDLKDAQKSIPKGTLLAILITTLIYLMLCWMVGSTNVRDAYGPLILINGSNFNINDSLLMTTTTMTATSPSVSLLSSSSATTASSSSAATATTASSLLFDVNNVTSSPVDVIEAVLNYTLNNYVAITSVPNISSSLFSSSLSSSSSSSSSLPSSLSSLTATIDIVRIINATTINPVSSSSSSSSSSVIQCPVGGCKYGIQNDMQVMQLISLFGPITIAGIVSATLSSALASLVSAPRVFQAVCKDQIFPYIHIFAKGYGKNDDPRRSYGLAFVIGLGCICIGELNAIAPLISNFFLMSYALINYSCVDASLAKSPGWRPAFKFYSMWLSLLGALLCVAVMFIINWSTALITIVLVGILYFYVHYRKPDINWGSSGQAHVYRNALQHTQKLMQVLEHVKNFRPQVLALTSFPSERPALVDFCTSITKNISLMVCGHVIIGDPTQKLKDTQLLAKLAQIYLAKKKSKSFYTAITNPSLRMGVQSLLQCVGVGKLRPNTLLMGFKSDWLTSKAEDVDNFCNIIQDWTHDDPLQLIQSIVSSYMHEFSHDETRPESLQYLQVVPTSRPSDAFDLKHSVGVLRLSEGLQQRNNVVGDAEGIAKIVLSMHTMFASGELSPVIQLKSMHISVSQMTNITDVMASPAQEINKLLEEKETAVTATTTSTSATTTPSKTTTLTTSTAATTTLTTLTSPDTIQSHHTHSTHATTNALSNSTPIPTTTTTSATTTNTTTTTTNTTTTTTTTSATDATPTTTTTLPSKLSDENYEGGDEDEEPCSNQLRADRRLINQVTEASNVNRFCHKQKGFIDVWWLFDDGGMTLLIPYLMTTKKLWSSCKLRIYMAGTRQEALDNDQRHLASLLHKFRIKYSSMHVITDIGRRPSAENMTKFLEMLKDWRVRDGESAEQFPWKITDSELSTFKNKTYRQVRLKELLLEHSHDATFIVMTLPMPKKGLCSPGLYMAWLDVLSRDLPPMLLIRGNQENVLTFYS